MVSRAADDPNDPNCVYTANGLDQYTHTHVTVGGQAYYQSFEYDADGNLTDVWKAGDMNCDGIISYGDVNGFTYALQGQAAYEAQYPNCNWLNADVNGDGTVSYGDLNAFLQVLNSGNTALAQRFAWDSENRLVAYEPLDPNLPEAHKVTFKYDYQGRRIEKTVYNWVSGAWQAADVRRFVYHGWLMLMELDPNNQPVRKYTWGPDLAGRTGAQTSGLSDVGHGGPALQGAGGIGGLLAVQDTNATPGDANDDLSYVYFYDGNGNVGQVVNLFASDPNAAIVAKYEYDPYGNVTAKAGAYADTNPFRWSTKYFDAETGLSYFGARYYHAGLGRWINRDPIGECGGKNLYGYAGNDPVDRIDPLGYMHIPCPWNPHCYMQQADRCPGKPSGGQPSPPPLWPLPPGPVIMADPPLSQPPDPRDHGPQIPFRDNDKDIVTIHCMAGESSKQTGPRHCYVMCTPAGGKGWRGDGTGPRNPEPPGGEGNGHPGWHTDPDDEDKGSTGGWSGRYEAPPGTCDCLKKKGEKLNSIPDKEYGYSYSNSNSVASLLLRACGVNANRPAVTALGWGGPVYRGPCEIVESETGISIHCQQITEDDLK